MRKIILTLGVLFLAGCSGAGWTANGRLKLADGTVYTGEYQNNLPNGHGTQTWLDGSTYVGQFANGQLSGQGTYTLPDGERSSGNWTNGERNGQGTNTLSDGSAYSGIWKNGKLQPTPKVWPQSKIPRGAQ